MRIVELLVGNPPQSVSDLMKSAGVTRTAVMEQLHELVARGFVERQMEHSPGRGRPRYLYAATDAGLQLFGNHEMIVAAIWRAVARVGGEEMLQQVLKSVAHELADQYNRWIDAREPLERLRQLVEVVRGLGMLIDIDENDGSIVQKRSCAFAGLHGQNRDVCCVGREVMAEVVGCPIRRIACRYDGAPCCTFQIVDDEQAVENEPSGE